MVHPPRPSHRRPDRFQAAFVCAPGPLFRPEHLEQGLDSWKPERILGFLSSQPDRFVEIGQVWEQKWAAIREHRSQGRHQAQMEEVFRDIGRELGARSGLEMAEGVRLILPT